MIVPTAEMTLPTTMSTGPTAAATSATVTMTFFVCSSIALSLSAKLWIPLTMLRSAGMSISPKEIASS